MKIYGRSLEDYKRSDPDGAMGYWMDLFVVVTVNAFVVGAFVSVAFVIVFALGDI